MDFAFLHGGGQGGWVWDETIAAMKAQSGDANRYLALDVPGCGTKRERDTASIQFDEIAILRAQTIILGYPALVKDQ